MICVSIVSHGHGKMIQGLVKQVLLSKQVSRVIVTLNIPEDIQLEPSPKVRVLQNEEKKGFGANHNAAFKYCESDWFLVLNPDVVLLEDPFSTLIEYAHQNAEPSILSPLALNKDQEREDNWRRFPTLFSLIQKAFKISNGTYSLQPFDNSQPFTIDWASGLFLFFPSIIYRKLEGFNEKYFMYYEDVEICHRAHTSNIQVKACPSVKVIHYAQRASRKNFQHMMWHARSLLRYLLSHPKQLLKLK